MSFVQRPQITCHYNPFPDTSPIWPQEFADRVRATAPLAKDGFYVIVRDWLAEMTMMMHRTGKLRNKKQMPEARSFEEMLNYAMFAGNFINSLTPAIKDVATRGIKVCANVGASDTKLLAQLADKTCKEAGQPLKVAWIEGNDVTGTVESMLNKGEGFNSHAQHMYLVGTALTSIACWLKEDTSIWAYLHAPSTIKEREPCTRRRIPTAA